MEKMKNKIKKNLNPNTILHDRTTLQIRKETLKKWLKLKNMKYHPRMTYDEMAENWINKELNGGLKKDLKKARKELSL